MQKYGVLVVDDHPILRAALRRVVEQELGLSVCGEAASVQEALGSLASLEVPPRLIILDLALEHGHGFELIDALQRRGWVVDVVVLTSYDDASMARRALQAGVKAYLVKTASPDELVFGLRQVLAGERYLCPRIKARLGEEGVQEDGAESRSLSAKEEQIFGMLGQGLTAADIARELAIAYSTVDTYLRRIRQKLGVSSSQELRFYAVRARGDASLPPLGVNLDKGKR